VENKTIKCVCFCDTTSSLVNRRGCGGRLIDIQGHGDGSVRARVYAQGQDGESEKAPLGRLYSL
jgi:hypothetical protein